MKKTVLTAWIVLNVCTITAIPTLSIASESKPVTVEDNQASFGLAYLVIQVKQNGKTKEFKTPNITGSKAKLQKELKAYINKYVPKSSGAQCKLILTQTRINKTTSGNQKSKNVSGDGLTIHQNISTVLNRLI